MTASAGRELFDVAVCGSANVDLVAYVSRLPSAGQTIQAGRWETFAGGKGGNQAIAAARLGARVKFVGSWGSDDYGRLVATSLADAGIDVTEVAESPLPTGVALIVVDERGDNIIVTRSGANETVAAPSAGRPARVWVTQAEVSVAAVVGTLGIARAQAATAIINPSPAGIVPSEIVGRFDIAVVNELELDALDGHYPPRMVVTRGAAGVVLLPGGEEIPAYPAVVVDTTGAGDALMGGLSAGLAQGHAFVDAVRLGMASAAVCVGRNGAQIAMPTRAEVDRLMRGAAV